MGLAPLLALAVVSAVTESPAAQPPTCLHAYFGLPADTPAGAAALRTAILRRYPLGTSLSVANELRRAASRRGAPCVVSAAGVPQPDGGLVEQIGLRPRIGTGPEAGVARLQWAATGLADVRVTVGRSAAAPRP